VEEREFKQIETDGVSFFFCRINMFVESSREKPGRNTHSYLTGFELSYPKKLTGNSLVTKAKN